MKIAVASDHGGFYLKEAVAKHLIGKGIEVLNLGIEDPNVRGDYPVYAKEVAHLVRDNEVDYGILCCGTGIGMSITANKVSGIRAAVVGDVFSAIATKEHNNANIICLGERVIGEGLALLIVDAWLEAEFQGGRHSKRIHMIEESD